MSIQAAGLVSVLRNMCAPRPGELEKSWLQPRDSRQHFSNSGFCSVKSQVRGGGTLIAGKKLLAT